MVTYAQAGVDVAKGDQFVERLRALAPAIGGFTGLFPFGDHYLTACTDGVGTKLKIAFACNKHNTIGIDLVAMCVNDLITVGAKPLFFLDYFASSSLDPDQAEEVIKGILEGCKQSDCQLLGGETAEMPGFYHEKEYDLSGFSVGAVHKDQLVQTDKIAPGHKLIGLPSSGVHSNGFSLVRAVVDKQGLTYDQHIPVLKQTLGDELLTPTAIYVEQVLSLLESYTIHGIAHITGGGLQANTQRVLPEGLTVSIAEGSWEVPAIFSWLQEQGGIADSEMEKTFNRGIGMVLVTPASEAEALAEAASGSVIGEVIAR